MKWEPIKKRPTWRIIMQTYGALLSLCDNLHEHRTLNNEEYFSNRGF